MNRLDAILQAECPTICVPRFGEFEPLTSHGHRFLSACDGLHIEISRPWLHTILPVASSSISLPYGEVAPRVQFRLRGLATFVQHFINEARQVSPNEHAAWLSVDATTGDLDYEATEVISQSGEHIRYRRPSLASGKVLAVDCHSHGVHPAFFSGTDDTDSLDDAKLEIVVGHLGTDTPSFACRLSFLGLSVDYSKWLTSLLYSESQYSEGVN